MDPIIGTEALASGQLTRGQLRWNYTAVHPDVYIAKNQKRTLYVNTHAAWLWTRRTGIVAGRAAAAINGVTRISDSTPIEMIGLHARRRPGVIVREERIEDDEVRLFGDVKMTTGTRTALDVGRRLPRDLAVEYLDQMVRACGFTDADVAMLVERYRGARGIPQARIALSLMDEGTRCREETRLRLWFHDGGLPRPRTNIVLTDGRDTTVIGMGWEDAKLGVSFFAPRGGGDAAILDLRHHELLQRLGWTEIGFGSGSYARLVMYRVRDELRRRRR